MKTKQKIAFLAVIILAFIGGLFNPFIFTSIGATILVIIALNVLELI